MREICLQEIDQEELIKRAQRKDASAEEALVAAYMPLVRSQAFRLSGQDTHLAEDLIQEGMLSVCRAIKAFDPRRGPFPAFVKSCVHNGMISILRRRPKEMFLDDLQQGVGLRGESPETKLLDKVEQIECLRSLEEALSQKERIVWKAYLQAGDAREAALLLGWPKKKVDNALYRIKRKASQLQVEVEE